MQKEKLRTTRIKKGFTQKQIADFLHTDISNYCRKENGVTKIYKNEWEKIAKFFDVSLEEIYEDDETKNDNSVFSTDYINYDSNTYIIPYSIIENLQDYIKFQKEENLILRKENEALKKRIDNLEASK